jgi:hypothetical protein
LASAASLVWLTNWRVVFSFSAMIVVDSPFVIIDQTVFCVWLRGADKVLVTFMCVNLPVCKVITIYNYLKMLPPTPQPPQKSPSKPTSIGN